MLILTDTWNLSRCFTSQKPSFDKDSFWEVSIPGEIHDQLHQIGVIDHPFHEKNFIEMIPMEKNHYWYQKHFEYNQISNDPQWLVFEGVDVRSEVYLNGVKLGYFEGMYGGPEYDVTSLLQNGSNEIIVHIFPSDTEPDKALEAFRQGKIFDTDFIHGSRYLKPGQLMGGNAFTRLVTAGIWLPVYLESRPMNQVSDFWIETLTANQEKATLGIYWEIEGEVNPKELSLKVIDPLGKEISSNHYLWNRLETSSVLILSNPQLWWPNGHGKQPLYTIQLLQSGEVVHSRRLGIRNFCWVRNDHSSAELTFEVNGVKIYGRGANIPGFDKMLRLERENYRWHVELMKRANLNVLRYWSGYPREDFSFYELCDENGIMILHDLPIHNSIHVPSVDLSIYDLQVKKLIRDLRSYTCLIAWIAGNEQLSYEIQDHPMRALSQRGEKWTQQLNPHRRYFMSSYSLQDQMSDEYDHYGWSLDGDGSLANSLESEPKMSVEFWPGNHSNLVGQPLRQVQKFLPQATQLWPPPSHIHFHRINTAPWNLKFNPGFVGARNVDPITAHPYQSWEELMYYTSTYSGFAVKALIDAWRSRLFHHSGSFPWCWHDQCPNLSSGLVDYEGASKALYYFVKRAYQPISICMKYRAGRFDVRSRLRSWIRIVNESGEALQNYRAEVRFFDSKLKELICITPDLPFGTTLHTTKRKVSLSTTQQTIKSGTFEEVLDLNGLGYLFPLYIEMGLPSVDQDPDQKKDDRFFSIVTTLISKSGELLSQSFYPFNFDWHESETIQSLEKVTLEIKKINQTCIEIHNPSKYLVPWIDLEILDIELGSYTLSDNFFTLLPGQSKKIEIYFRSEPQKFKNLLAKGLNISESYKV